LASGGQGAVQFRAGSFAILNLSISVIHIEPYYWDSTCHGVSYSEAPINVDTLKHASISRFQIRQRIHPTCTVVRSPYRGHPAPKDDVDVSRAQNPTNLG
jgi:hypothetical protein